MENIRFTNKKKQSKARRGGWTQAGTLCSILEKNQNAPRPSEPPPVRGENMSKRLGGILLIGYEDKTSSWHLNDFPYMVIILSQ